MSHEYPAGMVDSAAEVCYDAKKKVIPLNLLNTIVAFASGHYLGEKDV